MSKITEFYNSYHKKNAHYFGIISKNNFTYFNILPMIDYSLSIVNKDNPKILDVGCGVGTLAFYLSSKQCEVEGIDVSSRAISICNEYKKFSKTTNIVFRRADLESLNEKKKFDLIICTEVVEHIQNDLKFIKKLNSLLTINGILLLSTPSLNAPLYRLGRLKNFDLEVGHLRRYSEISIRTLLKLSGFRIVKFQKTESILRNSLFMFKAAGNVIHFIRGPLIPLFHKIDRLLLVFGESDLILVVKKEIK